MSDLRAGRYPTGGCTGHCPLQQTRRARRGAALRYSCHARRLTRTRCANRGRQRVSAGRTFEAELRLVAQRRDGVPAGTCIDPHRIHLALVQRCCRRLRQRRHPAAIGNAHAEADRKSPFARHRHAPQDALAVAHRDGLEVGRAAALLLAFGNREAWQAVGVRPHLRFAHAPRCLRGEQEQAGEAQAQSSVHNGLGMQEGWAGISLVCCRAAVLRRIKARGTAVERTEACDKGATERSLVECVDANGRVQPPVETVIKAIGLNDPYEARRRRGR